MPKRKSADAGSSSAPEKQPRRDSRKSKTTEISRERRTSTAEDAAVSGSTVHEEQDYQEPVWGPYLSERQWGTVREDVSVTNECWLSFEHDEATYRSYTSGEDGLFGFSDNKARLCMSVALWNHNDSVLKERLFGLSGPQGNHGEDVKECYYYLDGVPDHSYMKGLYKYPHNAFPYGILRRENAERTMDDDEHELLDTGVFDNNNYFDVFVEYARVSPTDILWEITVFNRGAEEAELDIIPQIWFRNTWWNNDHDEKPEIVEDSVKSSVLCKHPTLGFYRLSYVELYPVVIFTENETNIEKLINKHGGEDLSESYMSALHARKPGKGRRGTKDGLHEYIINGNSDHTNTAKKGTKVGILYSFKIGPSSAGHSVKLKLRLTKETKPKEVNLAREFDEFWNTAVSNCSKFYKKIIPQSWGQQETTIARQAYAGLLWNKQYFGHDVKDWLKWGGPNRVNKSWGHMFNNEIISMPDKWEFPWYATWDLAFHMIPMCDLDPSFVKQQLLTFLSPRYMHPSGQLPAYEFDFSDVNPPVHAMAVLHAYRATNDFSFLKKAFQKLNINFNWWINKKQIGETYLFGGGFLGMDNVSCLHRSQLPTDCTLYQVDGTCWVAFFAVCMIEIAMELSQKDENYVDMVELYLDHYISLRYALNHGLDGNGLWNAEDGFYYDRLCRIGCADNTNPTFVKARAMIGLTALFPVATISGIDRIPNLRQRLEELLKLRREKASWLKIDGRGSLFLSMFSVKHLKSILSYVSDENEFLSPFGIRSLSKYHLENPLEIFIQEEAFTLKYCPGESNSEMFGGNSNWRGPIWFPMNYLIVESLEKFHSHYQSGRLSAVMIEVPKGSNQLISLEEASTFLVQRLLNLFLPNKNGSRPCHGHCDVYTKNQHWKDLILFYEYFHADTGRGCGASHQTGWTALIVNLMKKRKSTGTCQVM